ncbi:MAG TPA: outer membrane beta-barrel protein [Chitinophagaceae bacterium]|nr:outer membrane beta-barrel protein [Chitinophagaceae bacterium]
MKKLILFLAIALIGLNSNAQWGIKAGVNFSNFTGDDAGDTKTLVPVYFGFFYNAKISQRFSIEPQLMYTGHGAKDDQTDLRLKLNYLSLTGLGRFNLPSGLFFGTGPEFGLLLSARLKDDNNVVNVKDSYEDIAIAWAFAVGYDMKNGFGIYGRYNLGLTTVTDDPDGDLKNSVFQLGFRFMLQPN